MTYIQSRLGFVIACLAVALFCWVVVFLPPYEKIVYAKSPVLSKEEVEENKFTALGYRGGEDIDRVHSIEDFSGEKGFKNVVIEIDTNELEATGVYYCIDERYQLGDREENRLKVFFLRTTKSYGQFYIATLESGERVPVFIDDSLVNVRKNGIVQLPIGLEGGTWLDFEEYGVHYLYEHGYIDCATGFATGPEMQDFRFMEKIAVVVIVVVLFIGFVIACIMAGRKNN